MLRDYFFQIVLFLAGVAVGFWGQTLKPPEQKKYTRIFAGLLIAISLIWVGYEVGNRDQKGVAAVVTNTPPPTTVSTTISTPPTIPTATSIPPTATRMLPTATSSRSCPPSDAKLGDTWVRPADKMVMVYVPAGQFLMGSLSRESQDNTNELPQHSVTLDSYWIDRTEVTNAQYRLCVEAKACDLPQQFTSFYQSALYTDHPVVYVNWYQAKAYAEWVGGHLPTEAEWEKAARGTDGRAYPWGNNWDTSRLNAAETNESSGDTKPVGSYSPRGDSPYGVADMAGNVAEWVTDWYDPLYYTNSPAKNPQGPPGGTRHVVRGGSWYHSWQGARCAYRYGNLPNESYADVGFRVAFSLCP